MKDINLYTIQMSVIILLYIMSLGVGLFFGVRKDVLVFFSICIVVMVSTLTIMSIDF